MALNLGIFGRIGMHLGLGRSGGDTDTWEQRTEHDGKQHDGNNQRVEAAGYDTDNQIHDWQDSKYANNDFDQHVGDQHTDSSSPLPSSPNDGSGAYYVGEGNEWSNDADDLHAALAALPDTGAMLDAAISHLDSCFPSDLGSLDVTHFDDHGGSTGIT